MKHRFFQRKRNIILLAILLIIIIFSSPLFSQVNYNALLDADSLNIYSKNQLITTVDRPAYLIDNFRDDIVGIYVTDTSKLGVHRWSMSELYRLEFLKDGKIISSIKILTPKTQKNIKKIVENNIMDDWGKLDDHYVIMNENFQYFLFGKEFFENLSEVLKE